MNGHDPDRDIDDLLGDDGGKIGNLYRRLPRYEPPRRLDRAVLSEAARAVHSGKPPRRQRWLVGVGSAAGLVLAAGIAWRIGHDPMNANNAAGPASQVVPVQPISESASAKREAPAQSADAPAEADAAAASESRLQGAADNRAAKDELKTVERKAKAARQPASAAPMKAPETPKPAPPPSVASPRAEPFPAAPEQRERAQEFEKSSAGKSEPTEAGGAAVQQTAPASARGLSSPTQLSGSVELRRDMELAPQDWLAHVRLLLRQGRPQQASESLRLFQRAHPDWTIPDDLRPLLK
jgi:hypothetical protein